MTSKFKKDDVTVSFHYFLREKKCEKNDVVDVPITQDEFNLIYSDLRTLKSADINDEAVESNIKFGNQVVIKKVEQFDQRYISGIYEGSYWGHSFNNSKKGKIPADSLNLRPFFFLLYLSNSGKVYIASQYLGNFGKYSALKKTLLNTFENRNEVRSRTINASFDDFDLDHAREVEVRFCKKSKDFAAANTFGNSGALAFKKESENDGFEKNAKENFLSLVKKKLKIGDRKKKIAAFLKEKELLDVDDDEIQGCKVIIQVGPKSKKVIQILDHTEFATRFHADVEFTLDGHPEYDGMKKAALELLTTSIIARKEDD